MDKNVLFTLVSYILVIAAFVGASVGILRYILRLLSAEKPGEEKYEQLSEPSEQKQKEIGQRKKKKTRAVKQDFKHALLYSTLKCVKGEVCDMDYSNNGKFLATCSTENQSDSGASVGDISESSPDSTPKIKPVLSRRQRKNRRDKNTQSAQMEMILPAVQWTNLGGDEATFAKALLPYCLTQADRFASAYPMEVADAPGMVFFYSVPRFKSSIKSAFNINAQEFVPRMKGDSAYQSSESGSGTSSDSEEYYDDHMAWLPSEVWDTYPSVPLHYIQCPLHILQNDAKFFSRKCMRCNKTFTCTRENELVKREMCMYHTGIKCYKVRKTDGNAKGVLEHVWSCCGLPVSAPSCLTHFRHVWSGTSEGFNGPFENYVKTKHVRAPNKNNCYGVYAIDCEMSFTKNGLDLTKVTVINMNGKVIYDTYVFPDNHIIDYNTLYSGVTAKHMTGKNVKTLREVQNDLMGFINADTILIGHGLENDLRALRILHEKVVDTAFLYPHNRGYPYKQSLKDISLDALQMTIQCGSSGHNSYEDAFAAMQLTIAKVMYHLGHKCATVKTL